MALQTSRRILSLRSANWYRNTGFNHSSAVFEADEGTDRLEIDHDSFEEMGRPQRVTITIEPGDHLNGG